MESQLRRVVPDTSLLINRVLSRMIEGGELRDCEIIIPVPALDELQAQASRGRSEGFVGLEEIKRIREIGHTASVIVRFAGERPTLEEIRLARGGRIDALIRDVARRERAILYTSDYVQALVAEAEGVEAVYVPRKQEVGELSVMKFMTHNTMSLHLKVGAPPIAKTGALGKVQLVKLRDEPLSQDEVQTFVDELLTALRTSKDGYLEIVRQGAVVAQLGDLRFAVAKPPFSDELELTIVRPLVRLKLEDYNLSDRLISRLSKRAEGVLIAGPPGSGKTTFASSLAEFYSNLGKVVKTLESPRDLLVGPEITQYGPLEGDFEKTAEVLLLVRPDFTIFDEMRRPRDFQVFIDMRLAGVGMVGVIHASDPIDAIQRFLERTELGMLPNVVDTVIFLREGRVQKVYELSLVVRLPKGMKNEDLVRPIVEVRDFETGELEYEIYTFGDERVVVAIKPRALEEAISKINDLLTSAGVSDFRVERSPDGSVSVMVERSEIRDVTRSLGRTFREIERAHGFRVKIIPLPVAVGEEVDCSISDVGASFVLTVKDVEAGKPVGVYVDDEYLLTATVGKKGRVRVSKDTEAGRAIITALTEGKRLRVFLTR
ncbi:MAG: PINc/VapC family ATPase [Thaumarchaeota archaeon]|nr:PINc/VapC family ATPase [Candidatus Calditenuaceae archaeon]MDW8187050.1 PINc/VapC family ATPase [Nitrososphaerota archaeon]